MTSLLFDPPCFENGKEIPAYYYPLLKEIKKHKGKVDLMSTENRNSIFLSFKEYAQTSTYEKRIFFSLHTVSTATRKRKVNNRFSSSSSNQVSDNVQVMLYTLAQKEGFATRTKDVSRTVFSVMLSILGIILAIFTVAVMKVIGIALIMMLVGLMVFIWVVVLNDPTNLSVGQEKKTKYIVNLTDLGEETLKKLEAYASFFKGTTAFSEYGVKPYSEKAWEYATNKISTEVSDE